jgi:pyruvate/2-oxoglutarate dehydrogenase complex dihydrolipoamide dehydrogenase (E3) component
MYDIIVIGMGPAGMAVLAMAVKLGLSVLGIEKNKIGGE